ncbi:unnamed protein product [Kluyveromyces dobzhanskii CBS 2104]|uniref:21S rRNA pseudouridine(2819) synthase n=1 Tax=Kluyveromyces dobzhanskii CBS 2104 TaxID=1427455 RepID=A0A0A8L713_9SACH|nr:unnamed protein product [Kluyveromyces dobzhanskii CBS 2104]
MLKLRGKSEQSFKKTFKVVSSELLSSNSTQCTVQFPLRVEECWYDKHLAIFNKPPMVLSQKPDMRTWYNTHEYSPPVLIDLVESTYEHRLNSNESNRTFWPIHRIDTPVSGGIVYALTKQSAQMFSKNLRVGGNAGYTLTRKYIAKVTTSEMMDRPKRGLFKLNGATTYFQRVDDKHVIFQLVTGKKHQIRKLSQHALHLPIYNDSKYGGERIFDSDFQIALHSAYVRTKIGFKTKEHIFPVPDGFRMIWGDSIDQNGNFSNNISQILKEDWTDSIKECLLKLKQQEVKPEDNRLVFVP